MHSCTVTRLSAASSKRRHDVLARFRGLAQLVERPRHVVRAAAALDCLQRFDLRRFHRRIDLHDRDGFILGLLKRVDADDQLFAGVDLPLLGEGGVGDLAAEEAGLDGGDHAALLVDRAK